MSEYKDGEKLWVRAEVEAAYGVCRVNEEIQVNVGGTRLWVPITDIRPSPPPDLRALAEEGELEPGRVYLVRCVALDQERIVPEQYAQQFIDGNLMEDSWEDVYQLVGFDADLDTPGIVPTDERVELGEKEMLG